MSTPFTPPPMNAPASSGNYTQHLIEQGQYPARLVWLMAVGTQESSFNGEIKRQKKLILGFELPTELLPADHPRKGEPSFISETFTFSMSEKASMRAFINQWRGKILTDEEAQKFDIGKMLSAPAVLNIVHKASKADSSKIYANIGSVSSEASQKKMMPTFSVPPQVNQSIYFNVDWLNVDAQTAQYAMGEFNKIPEYYQKKIMESPEWKDYTGKPWFVAPAPKESPQTPAPETNQAQPQAQPQVQNTAPVAQEEEDDIEELPF